MIENIKKLLASDLVSNYQISKIVGMSQTALSNLTSGKSEVEKMQLGHALKLNEIFEEYEEEIEMEMKIKEIEKWEHTWISNVLEFYIAKDHLAELMIEENRDDVGGFVLELLENDDRVKEFDEYENEEDASKDGYIWIDEISKWVNLE